MNTEEPSTFSYLDQVKTLDFLRSLKTKEQLAKALGVTYSKHLRYYLFSIPHHRRYNDFDIPKRNGGVRTISAPASGLKTVQRRLASLLMVAYGGRLSVHGFSPKRDIVTNAREHLRKRFVLNIDLEDFFGSINFGRVRGMFLSSPYGLNPEVSTIIAQICCHNNKLPQGAPTSPVISNMICGRLDAELKQAAKEYLCVYTRYADDITISSRSLAFPADLAEREGSKTVVGEQLLSIINRNGFRVNSTKVRLLRKTDRQEVTGLTVNRFVNIDRRFYRSVRATIHAVRRYGFDQANIVFKEKYTSYGKARLDRVLMGRIQFIGHIRGWNDEMYVKLRDEFNDLNLSLRIPEKSINWESYVQRATWIIEDDADIHQGTAFFVESMGIVTCAHCVGTMPVLIHPSEPTKRLKARVVKRDDVVDLAILSLDDETFTHPDALRVQEGFGSPRRGDQISLIGYPGYAPGHEISIKDGKVQSFTTKSGIRRFNISALIIAGNSGGPVLNQYGKVIGVAVTGADVVEEASKVETHSVIPIDALRHLK